MGLAYYQLKRFRSKIEYLRDRIQSRISKNSWKYLSGSEPISINSLISPLRYDIVVRIDYFRFLEENLTLFKDDFQQYIAKAMRLPYFTWFTKVVCTRFSHHLLNNRKALALAFENRIRKSTELYLQFQQIGFDSQNPVTLHSGEVILPTSTGKRINIRYYAGDGCHRIALLKLMGHKNLLPQFYRIKYFCKFSPLDNTNLLIRSLSINKESYLAFLSIGYSNDKLFTDKKSLLEYVQKNDPVRLSELESIIERDEAELNII